MAENTGIEWTRRLVTRAAWTHGQRALALRIGAEPLDQAGRWLLPGFTWNHWRGCAKVSPACHHCYAESLAKRNPKTLGGWGPGALRVKASGPFDKLAPHKWDRWAADLGVRFCVFALSMGDWLDDEVEIGWLAELLLLIQKTPNLDWLLLTKRPENFQERTSLVCSLNLNRVSRDAAFAWSADWSNGRPPPNVAIGITAEDDQWLQKRLPHFIAIPARIKFLSCEPLLGPLHVSHLLSRRLGEFVQTPHTEADLHCWPQRVTARTADIDWIIAGGESGSAESRPTHPEWLRTMRDECAGANIPFFFKQWGDWLPAGHHAERLPRDKRCKGCDLGGQIMLRAGKKNTGSLLDGRQHHESPFHEP